MNSNGVNFSIGSIAWLSSMKILGFENGILVGNASWFGLAMVYFGFLNKQSANWVIPKSQRKNKLLMSTTSSSMAFLGGMNAGMVALSILFLLAKQNKNLFRRANERRVLFVGFAVGHLSQVVAQKWNPPGILWYIYWMDLAQSVANLYAAKNADDL